jgi:hypothetical protein
VIGQAVLGFVLPWVLAMVAVPLEMLLDSGRHVVAGAGVFGLNIAGHAAQLLGKLFKYGSGLLASLYDVYIAVPLRIESSLRSHDDDESMRPNRAGAHAHVRGESLV